MRWLLKRDYQAQIRDHVRQSITQANDYTLEDAEDAAIEQASGYLRHKYDMAKVFAPVMQYDSSAQYNEGEVVHDSMDRIYIAKKDSPGTNLLNTADWHAKDPRNKHLITVVVDLTVYLLFTNNGRTLSELRVKRYDDAIDYLERVQNETVQPDLPIAEGANPSGSFTLGSNLKLRNKW
jgi:hypothetical protein